MMIAQLSRDKKSKANGTKYQNSIQINPIYCFLFSKSRKTLLLNCEFVLDCGLDFECMQEGRAGRKFGNRAV